MRVAEPVKRIVHFGSRNYGRLTARHRVLPSFLICGGQRCGTTSLYRALAAHPAILKAVLHKGVHYFDIGYHRGMHWYRGHFPTQRTADRVADRLGVPAQAFESSPYYLYHPHAVDVPMGFDAVHHELQRRIEQDSDATDAVDKAVRRADEVLGAFDVAPHARELTALLYLIDLAARYLADRQAEAGARLGVLGRWLLPVLIRRVERLT